MQYVLDLLLALFLPVTGVVLFYTALWLNRDRLGVQSPWKIILIVLPCVVIGWLSIRLFAMLEGAITGESLNMRAHGLFFIEPIVFLILFRSYKFDKTAFFDSVALANLPTIGLSRINCMVSGCDQGRFIFNTQFRWPIRETEIVFCLVAYFVFLYYNRTKKHTGELYPLFMIVYNLFRFFLEGFYDVQSFILGVHPAHIWSAICVLVGFSLLFEMRGQKQTKMTNTRNRR